MTNTGDVYTTLESVNISSNVFVFQVESPWNQELVDTESNICALSIESIKVHFKRTGFVNNTIHVIFSSNSELHFHGVNICRNNTGVQCGGALVLSDSQLYLHQGTQVYILGNTAHKYGGSLGARPSHEGLVPRLVWRRNICEWRFSF